MNNKGLTLIELVIAVFVISVGVVGSFSVLQKVIISTSISSTRLVASYLAQEGIEIVRNIRDTNWVEGDFWLDDLNAGDCSVAGPGCEADYNFQRLEACSSQPGGQCRYLRIENGGFYNYGVGRETTYKRKIFIVNGTDFIKITIQVDWEESGRPHTISVQENLYNWYAP